MHSTALPQAAAATRAELWRAAIVAATLGALLLFTAGFAAPSFLHNAAHDTRHAFTFPCH